LVTTPIVRAARLLGDLGDDRGRARPGPATEPGGDEDHVRIDERLAIFSESSSAARWPIVASPPAPSHG
jgi:hypothetical protein